MIREKKKTKGKGKKIYLEKEKKRLPSSSRAGEDVKKYKHALDESCIGLKKRRRSAERKKILPKGRGEIRKITRVGHH